MLFLWRWFYSSPIAFLGRIYDPTSYTRCDRKNWLQGTLAHSTTSYPDRFAESGHHWYCRDGCVKYFNPFHLAKPSLGSGKTAAFVIPMLTFISNLPPLTDENRHLGPYALIMAPTRELAQQIEAEARKFAGPLGFTCVSIVGGVCRPLPCQFHYLTRMITACR